MPEQRTEASSWQSRFGGGWVSGPQYLAENMCDRKARHKRTELPAKFWDKAVSPVWHREFRVQIRHANSLLKVYSVEAVVRALRTTDGRRCYSLGAKWLDPLIQEEQLKLDRDRAKQEERLAATKSEPVEDTPKPVAEPPRPTFVNRQSALSKLRDLD